MSLDVIYSRVIISALNWDFIPRSRDFLNQLGCLGDFYFKNSISGSFPDVSKLQVLNLVIKFLVKLAK